MKKKILSFLLILVCLFSFTACNLVEKDTEKDLKRVVASVNFGDTYKDDITKLQLYSSISSNASQYLQNGYTMDQVVDLFLEQLVQRRIIIQEAVIYLAGDKKEDVSTDAKKEQLLYKYLKAENGKASPNLHALLGDSKYNEAINSITKQFTEAIDGYEKDVLTDWGIQLPEEEEEKKEEEATGRPLRTTTAVDKKDVELVFPTEEEKIPSAKLEELKKSPWLIPYYTDHLAKEKPYVKIEDTKVASTITKQEVRDRAIENARTAFKKNLVGSYVVVKENATEKERKEVIEAIKSGDKDKANGNDFDEVFYEEQLVPTLEGAIVTAYQEALDKTAMVTKDQLVARFSEMFAQESQQFEIDLDSYATKLSGVGDNTFVLYNPAQGYGYIKHILLKFSDVQSGLLTKAQNSGLTPDQIMEYRKDLLEKIMVSDLTEYQKADIFSYKLDGEEEYQVFKQAKFDSVTKTIQSLGEFFKAQKAEGKKAIVALKYEITDKKGELIKDGTKEITDLKDKTEADFENILKTKVAKEQLAELTPSSLTGENAAKLLNEIQYSEFYAIFKSCFGAGIVSNHPDVYQADTANFENSEAKLVSEFVDWIFKFNEDPGMFNNKVDYLATPAVDIGVSEKFVAEFASASREVITIGVGAYKLIASDFGYHLVFCTGKIDPVQLKDGMIKDQTIAEYANQQINTEIIEKLNAHEDLTFDEQNTITTKLYNIMLAESKGRKYDKEIMSVINTYKKNHEDGKKTGRTYQLFGSRYKDLYDLA